MTEPQWAPSCSIDVLKARAAMYTLIRSFFNAKGLLEVETPVLGFSCATDPYLSSFSVSVSEGRDDYYLQTSPEFPMKRLLVAHKQAIYQICKTFRKDESGSRHNPEFSMLEWYQPGYSLNDLLNETLDLITQVCGTIRAEVITYREAFLKFAGFDPFTVEDSVLNTKVLQLTGYEGMSLTRLDSLDLILSHIIEPKLGISDVSEQGKGIQAVSIMTEYPSELASLAQIKQDKLGNQVAERFEIYINGLEIANAYHELTDSAEQRSRFMADNLERKSLGLSEIPIDEHLLTALEEGLPSCSGIALGLDRLLMIKLRLKHIDDVLAFPIAKA